MLSYVFFQDQGILVMFFAAMNLGIYVGVKSFGLVYFILVAFSALMIVAGFFVEKTSGVVIYILGILLYVILGLVGAGLMY